MENSEISWTHHTWNPWIGCTKVSDGCKFCYAETLMDHRYGKVKWGPQGTRIRTSEAYWKQPYKWNRKAQKEGIRYRVFCASLADVFEDREELIEWRRDLLILMENTPYLDWLLLTKRPENVMSMIEQASGTYNAHTWFEGMDRRVWIGTSVEDQKNADKRIPHLLEIPARIRFLSCEPLLGPIDFRKVPGFNQMGLDLSGWWVIVGGESGSKARPMHPDWARQLRDQCASAGVPYHFKQWGEYVPAAVNVHATWIDKDVCGLSGSYVPPDHRLRIYGQDFAKMGKHNAGRILDGQEWNEFP